MNQLVIGILALQLYVLNNDEKKKNIIKIMENYTQLYTKNLNFFFKCLYSYKISL